MSGPARLSIEGGHRLAGEIHISGNKNAALPMIAAALLTEEPVTLRRVPRIRDVVVMQETLGDLGADVVPLEGTEVWRSLRCRARVVRTSVQSPALCQQTRASFVLAGPLLARTGRAELPSPGGDKMGRRPLDTHIEALRGLGAAVDVRADRYVMSAPAGLSGADIFLSEMSVLATENALMAHPERAANRPRLRTHRRASARARGERRADGGRLPLTYRRYTLRPMGDPILTTFDWVPEFPRGFVRDLRVRWALEEAGLAYRVESVAFEERGPEHLAHQPFGQVPWLTDGDISIFESGAILLHIAENRDSLMARDVRGRATVTEWLFAALNSVETATLPWSFFAFKHGKADAPGRKPFDDFLELRLQRLEPVLGRREWLAETFSVADILMADVLRIVDRFDGLAQYPACQTYVARAKARPSFVKAHSDQLAHFTKADELRKSMR